MMLLLLNGHKDTAHDVLKGCKPEKISDIDVQDENGVTALMIACEAESNNLVSMLLELGASVDMKDKVCGDSVLHQCIKRNQWDICKELVAELEEVGT